MPSKLHNRIQYYTLFVQLYYIYQGLLPPCCTVLFICSLTLRHISAGINRPSSGPIKSGRKLSESQRAVNNIVQQVGVNPL